MAATRRGTSLSLPKERDHALALDSAPSALVIGVAMLAVFALAAFLMYRRVLPALLAVPLMAIAIAAVSGASPVQIASVVADGSVKLAAVIATVIFGAWLSRVTLATGIAETIVVFAAEYGGDRPAALALVLCAAVAVLFTSLTGLGAIIMVGSIVLPIMMTVGVPRRLAATLFLLSFALGFIFNIAQWKFYTTTFGVTREQLGPYALVLAGIDVLALLLFAFLRFRSARGSANWALAAGDDAPRKRVPPYALIAPVLPILLYFFLGVNPLVAFAISAVYGAAAARPKAFVPTLVAAAIRGVEDVAPAIVLFMGIGMLLAATALPSVNAALAPLVRAIAPHGAVGYVVLFGLLSWLALYRGPLNPFGVGIAVYTILAGLGVMPPLALVAALMAVVQVQNACDPTNTQNVWVANFTGVRVDEITRLTLPFQVGVATAATLAVALFGPKLLGIAPFAPASAAAAATMPAASFVFAAPEVSRTLAVAPADARSHPAAFAAYRQVAGGWSDLHAVWLDAPPVASACANAPFTALAVVRTEFYGAPGMPGGMDTALELRDCAGWPVDQWHVTGDDPRPLASDAPLERAGLAALFRLRTWTLEQPALSAALFARGLAYDPATGPTYFYSLFKTNDGQMRAFVRTGGPAYAAGLRTNDIVVKLDGKFWWEYGTFQTQRRAYDGLPHDFDLVRGSQNLHVALGAPYTGQ
ncbi:MAG: hypothetical protein GIW95_11315 [Candidatus Eremiobacteraeota bacterium]|nr:hypothetical protein [Candidatus Eremiobacteraeota bacterium]